MSVWALRGQRASAVAPHELGGHCPARRDSLALIGRGSGRETALLQELSLLYWVLFLPFSGLTMLTLPLSPAPESKKRMKKRHALERKTDMQKKNKRQKKSVMREQRRSFTTLICLICFFIKLVYEVVSIFSLFIRTEKVSAMRQMQIYHLLSINESTVLRKKMRLKE